MSATKSLGSAVRAVKRADAVVAEQTTSSELLETVDPVAIQEEIRYLGPVQETEPFTGFISRHYRSGRRAADYVWQRALVSAAAGVFMAIGFVEGIGTASVLVLAATAIWTAGLFVGALVNQFQRWRQRKPYTVPQPVEMTGEAKAE